MIVNIKSVYIEFDIFCILLLCVILYRMYKNPDQGTENIGFRNVVIGVLCGTVLDCLREGFNGTSMQINRTIDSCVIIMVCIVAFLWLLYVEERLHDRWESKSAKLKYLLLLPLSASILMAVLSITTDTVLSLEQSNLIQYGKYYVFVVVFPAAYLLYASAKILWHHTYGHYEGDQALKETANILKKVCKTRDVFLARYGGDEFAIIARFENKNEAEGLKSEIVKAFMARNENTDKMYDISLSIGISQYEDSKLAFFDRADRAMYDEKRQEKGNIT